MDDLTTKLADAANAMVAACDKSLYTNDYCGLEVSKHDAPQVDGAIEGLREALRLYDAAHEAQAALAAEPAMFPKQTSGTSEPVAWLPTDALAQLKDPLLLLRNVPLYAYAGEDLVPIYAAPVAQVDPWQPIETAPADHFPRLLRVRGLTMQGFRDVAGHWNVQTETSPHWRKLRGKPTHWMPLPQPPKEQP